MKYLDRKSLISGRVCTFVGTRPSFIKIAPVIWELERRRVDYKILHSGQHYSRDLNIYRKLRLPEPDYVIKGLNKCKYHGEQTAKIMRETEQFLMKVKPETVLVLGDANTNIACGLVARKLRLKVGHIEAGLRSYDWRTPEEHNRRILDHISDVLFAPTKHSIGNLKKENVQGRIVLTGNTIVEAVNHYLPRQKRLNDIVLLTLHREENVDDIKILKNILSGIAKVAKEFNSVITYPIHPRTMKRLREYKIKIPNKIRLIEPVSYIPFLRLMLKSRLILTDSGGVQEESCILGVPCVNLREKTDRPESVSVGASLVSGSNPDNILRCAEEMDGKSGWKNPFDPFGDGKIAKRIVDNID